MRTLFSVALRIIVICVVSLLGSQGTSEAASPPLRIGWTFYSFNYMLIAIANDMGFFEKEGVKVEMHNVRISHKAIEMALAGELDAGSIPTSTIINACRENLPILAVSGLGYVDKSHMGFPVLVRKDLWDTGRVKTMSDLKGMNLGVGTGGTELDWGFKEALRDLGIPESANSWKSMDPPLQAPAFAAKAIDAAFNIEPLGTLAVSEGHAVIPFKDKQGNWVSPLNILSERWYGNPRYISGLLWVTRKYIEKYPETVRAAVRALISAERYYTEQPDKAHTIMAKYARLTGEKFKVLQTLIETRRLFGLSTQLPLSVRDLQSIADNMQKFGYMPGEKVGISKCVFPHEK